MTERTRLERFLNNAAAIVLAAGRGTRMGGSLPKVCRRIDGVPCVRRLVDTLRIAGIRSRIVVVAPRHGPVRRALAPVPSDTQFVVQPAPHGTGDAARCGAASLPAGRQRQAVLIVAGDKVLEPAVIRRLARIYLFRRADLVLATGPREEFPESGAVLRGPDGAPAAIVEVADIRYHRFLAELADRLDKGLAPCAAAVDRVARPFEPADRKRALWVERVGDLLRSASVAGADAAAAGAAAVLRATSKAMPEEQVRASGEANLSVYLVRADRLRDALASPAPRNAQDEFYLTDIVAALASSGARIVTAPVDRADEIMAFNTPAELATVRRKVRCRSKSTSVEIPESLAIPPRNGTCSPRLPSAGSARFRHPPSPPATDSGVTSPPPSRDRGATNGTGKRATTAAARAFAEAFGGAVPQAVVHVPGRINLMGRHIDHQGGIVHPIAIDRGIAMAVRPRRDDRVRLVHAESRRHRAIELRVTHALARLGNGPWADAVNGPDLPPPVSDPGRGWGRYAEAAAARLQSAYPDRRLAGFDGWISGDLPEGYGLASSSALTITCLMAISIANGLRLSRPQAAVLAGEAEWYVGTRGGFADHAGILLAAEGSVRAMTEDGGLVGDPAPWPAEAALFLALSAQPAEKGAAARNAYNARIAAYVMACAWLAADGAPAAGPQPRRLHDFWPGEDGPAVAELLKRLARMPAHAQATGFDAVVNRAPWLAARLESLWERQADPSCAYPLRGTVLFGVAEMARARRFVPTLSWRKLGEIGGMMLRSHDGDRVSRFRSGRRDGWSSDCRPGSLRRIARRCRTSPDPIGILGRQPGAYGCSTPQIDDIVDATAGVPGVFGAQISGAGLGGAVMILARPESEAALRQAAMAAGALDVFRVQSAPPAEAVSVR